MGRGLESGLQEGAVSYCHVWLTAVSGSRPQLSMSQARGRAVAGGQAGRGSLALGTSLRATFTLAVSV